MRVDEVMTRRVFSVAPGTPVRMAKEMAAVLGVRHLPVTEEGAVLGVVCVCDLRELPGEDPVIHGMVAPPVTVRPDASLERAGALMRSERVGCLPVVDGGRIVGIVSRGDLSRRGLEDETIGVVRCAACGYPHNVATSTHAADTAFCRFCLERAGAPEDDLDSGPGD